MSLIRFEIAQAVLSTLVGVQEPMPLPDVDSKSLATWLLQHDLAPLAYHVYSHHYPALTQHLQGDYFSAVAENGMLFSLLERVLKRLNQAEIPVVILKGAAVSTYAYPRPELRMMSDIDLWVGARHIQDAAALLTQDGLVQKTKKGAFEQYGKIDLYAPEWIRGAIDLHAHMFAGYWLRTATSIIDEMLFAEAHTFLIKEYSAYRLCAEDALIHAALHVAINHKFDNTSLRTLIDIAFLAQQQVDWSKLLAKAQQWRIQKVLSFVLQFVADLFRVETISRHWPQTLLDSANNRLLSRFISPQHLLNGRDLSQSVWAYPFHILLLDQIAVSAGPLIWNKLRRR